jgi:hypothetical protein
MRIRGEAGAMSERRGGSNVIAPGRRTDLPVMTEFCEEITGESELTTFRVAGDHGSSGDRRGQRTGARRRA